MLLAACVGSSSHQVCVQWGVLSLNQLHEVPHGPSYPCSGGIQFLGEQSSNLCHEGSETKEGVSLGMLCVCVGEIVRSKLSVRYER